MDDEKNNLRERVLTSDLVYSGVFLKVKKDQVELPSGQKSVREYIVHPGAAMILPELPNGRLLMIRQYRHPLKDIFIEFPAGKIDAGETSLDTAHRELEEETGYMAQEIKFMTRINPVIGYADEFIDLYWARGLQKSEQKLDEGEHLELFELEFTEALQWLRNGKIPDVKTSIALFWYEKMKLGIW